MKKIIVVSCSLLMANSLWARLPDPVQAELSQIGELQRTLAERVEFLRAQEALVEPLAVRSAVPADRDEVESAPERRDALVGVDEKQAIKSGMQYIDSRGYLDAFKALFEEGSRENILNLAERWKNFSEGEQKEVLKTFSTTIENSTDWAQKNEITYEYASLEDGKSVVEMMQDMDALAKAEKGPLKNKIPKIFMKQGKNTYKIRLEVYVRDMSGKLSSIPYNFTFFLKPAPELGSTIMALLR